MALEVRGKTVVISGTLSGLTRSEAQAALVAAGARVSDSVSAKTDILFVGVDAGSKVERAEALGVPVHGEEDLLAVIGGKTASAKARVAEAKAAEEAKREALAEVGRRAATSLSGKTVCVTGTLEGFSRLEAQNALLAAGARPSDSVSARTDILVVGASPGSKLLKAEALGILTISEAQLRELLEEAPAPAPKAKAKAKKPAAVAKKPAKKPVAKAKAKKKKR